MGGIIVINATARRELNGIIDGVISVSGCFDTSKNMKYTHSRRLWQPLLTHGLKESFVAPKGNILLIK